jgi:hypothetical protein
MAMPVISAGSGEQSTHVALIIAQQLINFKSLHNNHTNLYDCRRNKFYMIADVTNFA